MTNWHDAQNRSLGGPRRRGERVGEDDAGQELPRPPGLERAHEAAEVGRCGRRRREQGVGAAEAEVGQDGARLGGQKVLERLVAHEGPGAEAGHGGQRLGQAGDVAQGVVEALLEASVSDCTTAARTAPRPGK